MSARRFAGSIRLTAIRLVTGRPSLPRNPCARSRVFAGNPVDTGTPRFRPVPLRKITSWMGNPAATGAPVVSVGSLGGGCARRRSEQVPAPTVSTGILAQDHVLAGDGVDNGARCFVGRSRVHTLTETPSQWSLVASSGTLNQDHALAGDRVDNAAPVVGWYGLFWNRLERKPRDERRRLCRLEPLPKITRRRRFARTGSPSRVRARLFRVPVRGKPAATGRRPFPRVPLPGSIRLTAIRSRFRLRPFRGAPRGRAYSRAKGDFRPTSVSVGDLAQSHDLTGDGVSPGSCRFRANLNQAHALDGDPVDNAAPVVSAGTVGTASGWSNPGDGRAGCVRGDAYARSRLDGNPVAVPAPVVSVGTVIPTQVEREPSFCGVRLFRQALCAASRLAGTGDDNAAPVVSVAVLILFLINAGC